MAKDKYGLRPLKQDKRDFKLGALFGLPALEDLPESFELTTPFPIKNQGNTDYCSAYASCGMSEIQEDVELCPEYSFALSKEISGDPEAWGQDLRSAVKAHVKYGAVPLRYTLETPKTANPRILSSYPTDYLTFAEKHRKQSYFKVTGQYDSFDNIRASIFEHKSPVILGVIWHWGLTDYILDGVATSGFGHALYCTGYDEEGLIIVNSYGEKAGINGKHRMTRGVINAFIPRYGAIMMKDMPPEEAQQNFDMIEWSNASWLKKIIIWIKGLWK